MDMTKNVFVRNQMYYGNFGEDNIGCEQRGVRPFVVIQNNVGNQYSPNIIVAPITSIQKVKDKSTRKLNATHIVLLQKDYPALTSDSVILTEQIRTISKKRVIEAVSTYNVALHNADIQKLNEVLALSIGIPKIGVEKKCEVTRRDIFFAELGKGIGFESAGIQPVLVIQNDLGNLFSPTTIIVPISLRNVSKILPTQVKLNVNDGVTTLLKTGKILTEQIRTIDKSRLIAKVGTISEETMQIVDQSLCLSIALPTLDKGGQKETIKQIIGI